MTVDSSQTNSRIWSNRETIAYFLLFVAAVFLVYSDTFSHQFLINWDDDNYVLGNTAAHGVSLEHLKLAFTNFYVQNYAPVQIISYMLDYEFWGLNPVGFKATNQLLHALNGLLFFHLLERLTRQRVASLLAAGIFLLHPVQVETVAWISQRKNLLAMLFFLLSFIWYIRYREGRGLRLYAASMIAFLLALLAKSVVVILPFSLFLFDLCAEDGRPRFNLRNKIPYVLIALATGCLAILSQSHYLNKSPGIRAYPGGNLITTAYTMTPVLAEYLRDCFCPAWLSPHYITKIRTAPDMAFFLSGLLVLSLVALGMVLYRRKRWYFFWYAFFFIGLLPVAQIVPLITLKNDRYLYFPMLGFSAVISFAFCSLAQRRGWPKKGVALLVALVFAGMIPTTWNQTKQWRSAIVLWNYAVRINPENWLGWRMLVLAYSREGDGSGAIRALGILNELKAKHVPMRGFD
ncbi:hypothetical protein Geob_3795 [Geotalea daltonii FRC-32]|uniref:Glycosyltransferase RgtA/B/C/D-like domain-containing protein n=1 Tax=Geotalea daltonii (strain DSM 22248 / JCM 15807 / FRC-32) TaxID=316067 RepID=B9M7M7_GEODF|nr:hypothetical protein [Geotalea daltonii]ACM22133.1 hypothetical protein Geob_3795 [Geotalea daltonii FRC-32]